MQALIEGWVDLSKVCPVNQLVLDPDFIADAPDEVALSLVTAGGEILRGLADHRPDDVSVDHVIADLVQAQSLGGQVGGLGLPPETLRLAVYDSDSANRYIRMLVHSMSLCLDYTPAGLIGKAQRDDAENPYGVSEAATIAADAAKQASKHASPYGLMMTMMIAAFQQATSNGLTPLQVMNAVAKFSEVVLCTTQQVVPRLPEGGEIDVPGMDISEEDVRLHQPNIAGSIKFLKAMDWKFVPPHSTSQTGLTPLVALAIHKASEIPILSVGYSPTDSDGSYAVKVREALAIEFEARNMDILVISTKPVAVTKGSTSYSVIGEAFVRTDGRPQQRNWYPAIAWPGCESVGAVIDLARSPHFGFNEEVYADQTRSVVAKLRTAMSDAAKL
jgi:hypothetical protein